MKLKNKKVLVTGAGSGIGKELVKQLVKIGASVIAVDININNLNVLKAELNSNKLSVYILDVSDSDAINKFKDLYIKEENSIDCLINNAGIIQPFINIDKIDDEIINRIMQVNFYGPLNLTRIFLPELFKRNEAHIVNVSSMGGFFPFPGQTIYGASKAALKLFTEGLYAELLNTNIKVTIVFPGAVDTDIVKNSNVEINSNNGKYKSLSANKAASIIIKSIEKNKFQVFVGSDSKIMNFMYKFNAKGAINYINKMMAKTISKK